MKKLSVLLLLFACITVLYAADAPDVKTLEIGAVAPAFTLPGVDGKEHSLKDFKDSKYLVMIFTCNHCPDARAAWGRINEFTKNYAAKGVQVVAVSTNSPKALMMWENGYSVYGDSFPEMKQVAVERKFVFPYLYDGDKQEAGLAYGARATPHVFIFGPERKLLYEGHFDDGHRDSGPADNNTVRDNIDVLLSGGTIKKPKTEVFGCSTKWAYKEEWVIKKQKEWEALPVTVEPIDLDGTKSLLENKTGRVRVINFWMTDSKQCLENFPVLIDTYRRYHRRSFDMVTIAIDPADNADEVLKILTSQHLPLSPATLKKMKNEARETNNFHLKSAYAKAVVALLRKGGDALKFPFTVVVTPGGKMTYCKELAVDDVELRRAIVKGIEGLKK